MFLQQRTVPVSSHSPRRRRWAVFAGATLACVLATVPAAHTAESPTHRRTAAASADPGPTHPMQRRLNHLVSGLGFTGATGSVRNAVGGSRGFASGLADTTTGRTAQHEARVRIGSNTKPMTATVVLQLVQEGKVALDAPIETYLPGLLRGEGIDGRAITVRQLLQQTSGLPDYDDVILAGDPLEAIKKYYEPLQLVQSALTLPATGAPGAAFSYSNTNFVVAGLVAEKASGRSIDQLITDRIIKPLGLTRTYWPAPRDMTMPADALHGYYFGIDVTELDPSWGWAAGQLISTPRDVNTFFAGLLGGKLLSPATLAEMKKTVPSDITLTGGDRYGLGILRLATSCGVEAWGHGGDVPGYHVRNATTADGRSAAIAVNSGATAASQILQMEQDVDAALCQ